VVPIVTDFDALAPALTLLLTFTEAELAAVTVVDLSSAELLFVLKDMVLAPPFFKGPSDPTSTITDVVVVVSVVVSVRSELSLSSIVVEGCVVYFV